MDEKNKNIKRERSTAWAMINWGIVQDNIKTTLGINPDQTSIEEALTSIEKEYPEEKLFFFEAKDLEKLLIQRLTKILYKNRAKEIKKKKAMRERARPMARNNSNTRVGFQVFPMGSLDDLKKMGIDDPKMMEELSKSLMDQLFGRRKKKDKEDDDDDDDPGASFYM
ncbi:MAG: hypothetical protein ACTSWX_04120 [Promethearchaeota archaeon]